MTWVKGGDGRGKTSLLRLISGQVKPQSGSVTQAGEKGLRPIDAADIFFIDPRTEAFDALTPTAWWASLAADWPLIDTGLLSALAEDLGLTPHLEKPLFMLSTGSKRKVWIAAAMASGAPLTLIDQPFAALDKPSIVRITALLQSAASRGDRVVVVADYEAPEGVSLVATVDLGD